MSWALAAVGWVAAAAGWTTAAVLRGVLAVSRRRVAKLKSERDAAKFDLTFATEKLAEFIDRTNLAEDKLRARDRQAQAAAAADPKRRAN
jgi:hypothetical protein